MSNAKNKETLIYTEQEIGHIAIEKNGLDPSCGVCVCVRERVLQNV